jgi:glycosyltransferase involved in cell wall biosynthesis
MKRVSDTGYKRVGVLTGGHIPSYLANTFNTMKMAQAFADLEYQIEVIAPKSLHHTFWKRKISDLYSHYGISRSVNIRWLFPSLLAFFSGNTSGDRIFCHRAAAYVSENAFDLVYCRSYLIPYYTASLGIPTFVETHTTYYDHPDLQKIYLVANQTAFKGLVTIHDSIKMEHIKRGIPSDKILVLEDGVDIKLFELSDDDRLWKKQLGFDVDKKYAMYAGQLYPDKGIEIILQAAKLLEKRQDLKFVMVGGFAKDRRHWEAYCRKQKILNVQFTGFVANTAIPQYLKAADCLLLPYKMDMRHKIMDINTTSPLKLFEYMAAKRPIVATGIPTVLKVLNHGHNALIAKPGDLEDFCRQLQKALDDRQSSQQLGQNASADVLKYTWQNRCLRILEICQK